MTSSGPVDKTQIFLQKWIARKGKRRRDAAWAIYHNLLPRHLRVVPLVHFILRVAIASSGPVVARILSPNRVTLGIAIAASLVLVVGHIILLILERAQVANHAESGMDELLIRATEVIDRQVSPKKEAEKQELIRSALGMIRVFAAEQAKMRPDQVSVSLVTYVGNHSSKMRLQARNPGNTRPTGREFDGKGVIGHHVCQLGDEPILINDLRAMPAALRESPTHSTASYRSILFRQLKKEETSGEKVIGFISIDCDDPYVFYGNRSKAIIIGCAPLFQLISRQSS